MTTLEILSAARSAKRAVALADSETRRRALLGMADALCQEANLAAILAANAADMEAARGQITDVMLDRLSLTTQRVQAMASGIREVAALPDPVGQVLRRVERPNGLVIEKCCAAARKPGVRPMPSFRHCGRVCGPAACRRQRSAWWRIPPTPLQTP